MIARLQEALGDVATLVVVTLSMVALAYLVARFVEAPLSGRMRTGLNNALDQIRNEPEPVQR
jgi:peptidoglycan/LPS O-acetylase OafA/YrhL